MFLPLLFSLSPASLHFFIAPVSLLHSPPSSPLVSRPPPASVWLCVLRASISTVEHQVDCDMTLAGAEVWEHLYHNHTPHINLITKPVSVCPVSRLERK